MQRAVRGGRFIVAIVALLFVVGVAWWWLRQSERAQSVSWRPPPAPQSEADPAGVVTIDVVHDGRPIEGVGVLLQRQSAAEPFFTEQTDGAGRVRFSSVLPGKYRVVTLHPAYPSVQRVLQVASGPQALTLALPAQVPAGAEASAQPRLVDAGRGGSPGISGQVVDENGEPVPRAQVGASGIGAPRFVSSDDEGRFEITGLVGPKVNVFATAPDYAQLQQRGIAVGVEGLRLVMSKAAELSGALAYDSVPEELHVKLCRFEPEQHQEVCPKHEYQKPPRRRFLLKRAPVGKFDLVFSSSNRELERLPVELRPGDRIEIPLQRL